MGILLSSEAEVDLCHTYDAHCSRLQDLCEENAQLENMISVAEHEAVRALGGDEKNCHTNMVQERMKNMSKSILIDPDITPRVSLKTNQESSFLSRDMISHNIISKHAGRSSIPTARMSLPIMTRTETTRSVKFARFPNYSVMEEGRLYGAQSLQHVYARHSIVGNNVKQANKKLMTELSKELVKRQLLMSNDGTSGAHQAPVINSSNVVGSLANIRAQIAATSTMPVPGSTNGLVQEG